MIWMEVPGDGDDTILLYGHLDKQPEMEGWRDGLGPWKPVRDGDRLYGRGGADDGYAAFASLTALEGLARQRRSHARCVVLIEACEESGSPDLPFYVEHLAARRSVADLRVGRGQRRKRVRDPGRNEPLKVGVGNRCVGHGSALQIGQHQHRAVGRRELG